MIALIKIAAVIALMLILISRKINLTYALAAGSILTGILFGRGLGIFIDIYLTLADSQTLTLLLVFVSVLYLSNMLTDTGILREMLASLERMIKDLRLVTFSMPLLIGLVPAPSGAMLSAPFARETGQKIGLKPERMLVINYWFRHITEYINPIYPGPILTTAIVGITFKSLFFMNLPIMLTVFMTGLAMFILTIRHSRNTEKPARGDLMRIAKAIWPVLLAIILPIAFKVNIALSVLASVALASLVHRIPPTPARIRKSFQADLLLLVFLVMYFKTVLHSSNAIEAIAQSLAGTSPLIVIILVPAIIGFLTGMTIAYVGLGFPLLIPLFNSGGELNQTLVMLAFVSGYMGILLSPMHLCLSVTQKYFGADYRKIYGLLLPAVAVVCLATALLVTIGWP
ncbi:MAG: DUF401 family protein [archaeon]